MKAPNIFDMFLVGLLCLLGDFGARTTEAIIPAGKPLRKAPIVQTTGGPVQGILEETIFEKKTYSAYKGIPYGSAMTGYLRFKAPVPPKPWTKVREAFVEGSVCPQIDPIDEKYVGDEDCLYLNVYTPLTNFNDGKVDLKAVLVFVHGGSYMNGYGNSSVYGPELFIENDVVMVSLNYRLGILGFIAIGHENATGNAGLKDQSLAFTWTRDNIKNFGGDPEKITIVGQSAGGASVELHCLSPMSRGKFRGTIAMSASALCPWAFHQPEVAKTRAFKLAAALDHPCTTNEELLHFFYNAPAYALVEGQKDMKSPDPFFKPTVDNSAAAAPRDMFMPKCPDELMKEGNICDAPQLTGYTSKEVLLFATSASDILEFIDKLTSTFSNITSSLPVQLPLLNQALSISGNLANIIAANGTMALINELSDLLFVACLEEKQNLMSERVPVYYYRMSYDSEYALHKSIYHINLNGTAHQDDVGYLFYNKYTGMPDDPNDPVSKFRIKLVCLWSNFIKYLNPTPDGEKDQLLNVTWPVSEKEGWQLNLDDEFTVHPRMASTQALIYQKLLEVLIPIYTGCPSLLSKLAESIYEGK